MFIGRTHSPFVGRIARLTGPNLSGMVSSSRTRSESPPEEDGAPTGLDHERDLVDAMLAWGRGHCEVAGRGGLPRLDGADVAKPLAPRDGRHGTRPDQRDPEADAPAGQGVEIAVVVMLMADHDGVDAAQGLDGRGDRLTLVIGRSLGEPRVRQDPGPADLDQLAGMADPRHVQGGAHDGSPLLAGMSPAE